MFYVECQGVQVPKLGYGTFKLKGDQAEASVHAAIEIGYRHIDTAQVYGNEAEVGDAISASGVPRSEFFVTTKVWIDNLAASKFESSVDASLEKLRMDRVDLLLLHWPNFDASPLAAQMEALARVQAEGKTRLIGVSNYPSALLREAVNLCPAKLATNQCEYHPSLSQTKVLEATRAAHMFFTSYTPLGKSDPSIPTIERIAARHQKSPEQVILRWHLQQHDVVAIPKAALQSHREANFDIFDFELKTDEMDEMFALGSEDGRMIDPEWAPEWDE